MASEDDIIQNINVNVNDEDLGSAFDKLKSAAQSAFDSLRDIFEKGEFGAGFEKLKESGTQAFEAIKEGGSKAFETIKGAGSGAAAELKSAFDNLGVNMRVVFAGISAAAATIAAGIGLAAKAVYNFVEAQSKTVNSLGDLSDKTRTAIKNVSELQTAYAHAGVSAGEFASGYSRLADVVEKTWDKIKKNTQTGVDTLEQRSITAARAAGALNKIQKERSEALNDKTEPNAGPIKPFVGDLVTAESTEKTLQKELELRQARLAAREAAREENEARRNDISQVTKGVQGLIDGNAGALKSFNASAENIVKGVVAAAGQGSEALKGLGDSFASVGSKAPDVKDVLTQLGAALKNIDDPALRSKVAIEALGKSGQSFLVALDSGKMDQFINDVKRMGGTVDETDKKIANNFRSAITGLNQDLENISTKISSAFGPGITDLITTFDDFLKRNQTSIVKLAEAIASLLNPALKGLQSAFIAVAESLTGTFEIFSRFGKTVEALSKADFKKAAESAKELLQTIMAVDDASSKNEDQRKQGQDKLAELRKKDFDEEKKQNEQGISRGDPRKPTQDQWNRMSETDKSKFVDSQLGLGRPPALPPLSPSEKPQDGGGLIPQASNSLIEGIKSLFRELPTSLPPLFKDKRSELDGLQKTASLEEPKKPVDTSIADSIKNSLQPLLDTINSLGTKIPEKQTEPISGIGIRGEGVKQATTEMASATQATVDPLQQLRDAARSAAEELSKVRSTDTASNDNNSGGEAVAVADGGHIRGPGSSTSDSIPAMLSDGEFVVKKSAVDRIGVDTLQAINDEKLHLAEGGSVKKRRRLPNGKIEEVTTGIDGNTFNTVTYDADYDERQQKRKQEEEDYAKRQREMRNIRKQGRENRENSAAAEDVDGSGSGQKEGPITQYVNGGDQAVLDSLNEASLAAGEADPNYIPVIYKKRKGYADGGLVGELARALGNIQLPRFANGGRVSLAPQMPRFSDGGSISLAPKLPRYAGGGAVSGDTGGLGSGMQHLGTVDLTTNHGNVRVAVDGGGIGQLRKAAVQRNMGSSPKSSWVK